MRSFTSFLKNTAGNMGVVAALSSTVVVGAAGYGLDSYRLENTRTILDQVVGLTCDRIENADYSLYPTQNERMEMARAFSADLVKQSTLDQGHTKIDIGSEDGKIKVAGASTIDATMMKIFGHDKLNSASARNCTAPSKAPPTKACTPDDLIYLNPGNFKIAAGTLVAGSKNYAATLFDARGNIKTRQVVGNGKDINEIFLKSSEDDDMVVVQPFNADGTTPAVCNPITEPPVTKAVCTREKAEQLARSIWTPKSRFYSDYMRNFYIMTPGWKDIEDVKPLINGSQIDWTLKGKKFTLNLSSNFKPEAYFYYVFPDKKDVGWAYLWGLASGSSGLPYNSSAYDSGAMLYRIMSDISAVWERDGQCVYFMSPIVLDLIAKGQIETSGVNGARYLIPQHRVNATVDFDMGGTGKTIRTEWITGNGQALLVDDRDGKAATDMNGTRLFGKTGDHAHGYLKLAMLDADKDSQISGDELHGLAAWIDNGDAQVQDGELKTLADVGITALSTVMTETPSVDGGTHLRSTAIMNGKTILTEDVWFGVDLTVQSADAGALQSKPVIK